MAAKYENLAFPALFPSRKPPVEQVAVAAEESGRAKTWAANLYVEIPWFAIGAALVPAASLLLISVAKDRFGDSVWDADTVDGFAYLALSWLICIPALSLALHQWRIRKRHRYPRLIGLSAVAAGMAFLGCLPLIAYDSWTWVGNGWALEMLDEEQSLRPGIEVSPDGTAIAMCMGFEPGVAKRVRHLLRGRPEIRTIELSGPGGFSREGTALARLIRERGLDTRVQENCASSCAIAFLAGRRRVLLSNPGKGLVGFHQSSQVLEGARVRVDGTLEDESYRISGATPAFIWRIDQTPFSELWRPTQVEFAAGGVPVEMAGPYDLPGRLWGGAKLSREQALARLDRGSGIADALVGHDPDVLSDTLDWAGKARDDARNEQMVVDRLVEVIGRLSALRLAEAGDAEVRKAGLYMHAAMGVRRLRSLADCALLGAHPNLLTAATDLPGPPDAASDPDRPYGALLRQAYGSNTFRGWPTAISLPNVDASETWGQRSPPRGDGESCDGLLAWYAEATTLGNKEGIAGLRARFSAFARTPVLTGGGT